MTVQAASIDAALRVELGAQSARFGGIEVLDSVDSSNAELLRRGFDQADCSLLLALTQSAGRGRHGRHWQTPAGGQLALSLALQSARALSDWQGLPLALGVTVADALRGFGADRVQLKWPNDVLIDGAKLGGMLLETRLATDASARVLLVIGIGINRQLEQRLELDQSVCSLADVLAERTPSLPVLAARIGCALLDGVERYAANGLAASLPGFAAVDALRGRDIDIHAADGTRRVGRALGVADDGRLRVEIDGVEQHLLSAEVSVRPR